LSEGNTAPNERRGPPVCTSGESVRLGAPDTLAVEDEAVRRDEEEVWLSAGTRRSEVEDVTACVGEGAVKRAVSSGDDVAVVAAVVGFVLAEVDTPRGPESVVW